jgi:hypothetical protein
VGAHLKVQKHRGVETLAQNLKPIQPRITGISAFSIITPVTSLSKYASNTLVVIQIPASQGQAANPQHFVLP